MVCCTENTDPLQLSAALLDKQSIKEQVKQLQHEFRHLGYCTYKELVDEGISVDDVHAWLISLDVFQQQEHQDFIKDHLTNIEKLTSLNNLWARLGIYWNFLNFDLLEHLVNGFGSKDLKQKMGSYNRNLQSFRKATRVCDFIDCWPSRVEPPPGKELKEFVTKVGYNWEDCTPGRPGHVAGSHYPQVLSATICPPAERDQAWQYRYHLAYTSTICEGCIGKHSKY